MVVIRLPKYKHFTELIFNYNTITTGLQYKTAPFFSGIGTKEDIIKDLDTLKDLIDKMDNTYIEVERATEYSTIQDRIYQLR
jgi:hypothetical protein